MPRYSSDSWAQSLNSIKKNRLYWLTPAILTDWIVGLILWGIDEFILVRAKPHQEDVRLYLNYDRITYPLKIHETIPGDVNVYLTFWLPLLLIILISSVRRSILEVHQAWLSFFLGSMLNRVVTDFIKMSVGRLRPWFLDACKYDIALAKCTGNPAYIEEGRRSFPSGHSSSAFYGCFFLFLFLAGKNRSLTFNYPTIGDGILQSRFLRLAISISPLFLSGFVSMSRWEDHWHHMEDCAVGSLLGIVIATVVYAIYWPVPWNSDNYESMESPRIKALKPSVGEIALEEDGPTGAENV